MLIKCPECGQDVSDRAVNCPKCNCAVKETIEKKKQDEIKKARKTVYRSLGICFIVFIVLFVCVILDERDKLSKYHSYTTTAKTIEYIEKNKQDYKELIDFKYNTKISGDILHIEYWVSVPDDEDMYRRDFYFIEGGKDKSIQIFYSYKDEGNFVCEYIGYYGIGGCKNKKYETAFDNAMKAYKEYLDNDKSDDFIISEEIDREEMDVIFTKIVLLFS